MVSPFLKADKGLPFSFNTANISSKDFIFKAAILFDPSIKIGRGPSPIQPVPMDPQTKKLVSEWRASLNDKERRLHDLAAVKLKKVLNADVEDGDLGSYFPEYCHAYKRWLAKRPADQGPKA